MLVLHGKGSYSQDFTFRLSCWKIVIIQGGGKEEKELVCIWCCSTNSKC